MSMLDLKDIDYVLAVAQYQSVSQAAKALFISQPALSKYLGNLEKRLGVPLFDRSGRQLALTEAGELYVKYAREIARSADGLREALGEFSRRQAGSLAVGMVRSGWQQEMPPIVSRLRERYPEATFRITDTLSIQLERKVLDSAFDLGLTSLPPQLPGLDSEVFERNLVLLAVPSRSPLARRGVPREGLPYPWIDLGHAGGSDFILQEKNCRMRLIADEVFQQERFTPKVLLSTESTFAALEYASAGVGVCMITDDYISLAPAAGGLRYFCVGEPVAWAPFGAIYRKGSPLSPLARDFIRLCKAAGRRRMAEGLGEAGRAGAPAGRED